MMMSQGKQKTKGDLIMERKITVKGIGNVTAKPDCVVINLTVDAVHKKYSTAVEEVSRRVNELARVLEGVGFSADSLKTVDFRVDVNYEFKKNRKGIPEQIKDGFRCVNRLKLEFDFDNDKLVKAIDAITKSVADPKLSLAFTVKDEEIVKDELLKSAGQNARRRAEILCEAAGGKLGNLITVNYNWNEISILSPSHMRFDNNTTDIVDTCCLAAPSSFVPDDINITDNAVFVWEIN